MVTRAPDEDAGCHILATLPAEPDVIVPCVWHWTNAVGPILFRPSGLCSDTAWTLLRLSIAEWLLLGFFGLLVLSFVALRAAV